MKNVLLILIAICIFVAICISIKSPIKHDSIHYMRKSKIVSQQIEQRKFIGADGVFGGIVSRKGINDRKLQLIPLLVTIYPLSLFFLPSNPDSTR